MIDLHFSPTPNGQKIMIALEELGLAYRTIDYDIFEGEQLTPAFGKINPNYKIPAIVDHQPAFGGPPHAVFESGAILLYLAEKTGKLLTSSERGRSEAIQWTIWQVAGLGPWSGQATHFIRYAPKRIDYAIARYTREVDRLLAVLEKRLGEVRYLAGDEYSIADIALWPARAVAHLLNIDISAYPNTSRWVAEIAARPAVKRTVSGNRSIPAKYTQARAKLSPGEWSNLFGDRMHQAVRR